MIDENNSNLQRQIKEMSDLCHEHNTRCAVCDERKFSAIGCFIPNDSFYTEGKVALKENQVILYPVCWVCMNKTTTQAGVENAAITGVFSRKKA